LGIVCRSTDNVKQHFLEVLDHDATRIVVAAERGLLRALGGSCQVPVAGKATLQGDRLGIKGLIVSLDGRRGIGAEVSRSVGGPAELGLELGQKLLAMGAGDILAEIAQYGAER